MKRIFAVLFILIGITSGILGIVSYGMDTGYRESNLSYGGDAYTGIQNAAAQTANNVMELAEATTFGFGSVLLVSGMFMIVMGVKMLAATREEELSEKKELPEQPEIPQPWTGQGDASNPSEASACPGEEESPETEL